MTPDTISPKTSPEPDASMQTGYLTDSSKLQQIGQNAATGGYDWANATIDAIAGAKNGAAHVMLIHFYKNLVPYVWQVLWCTGSEYLNCPPVDTPLNYDCSFGASNQGYPYNTQAYISTGPPPFSPPSNWNLADKLTGVLPNELNAIWYVMINSGAYRCTHLQIVDGSIERFRSHIISVRSR